MNSNLMNFSSNSTMLLNNIFKHTTEEHTSRGPATDEINFTPDTNAVFLTKPYFWHKHNLSTPVHGAVLLQQLAATDSLERLLSERTTQMMREIQYF
jgi:hypothetical protein